MLFCHSTWTAVMEHIFSWFLPTINDWNKSKCRIATIVISTESFHTKLYSWLPWYLFTGYLWNVYYVVFYFEFHVRKVFNDTGIKFSDVYGLSAGVFWNTHMWLMHFVFIRHNSLHNLLHIRCTAFREIRLVYRFSTCNLHDAGLNLFDCHRIIEFPHRCSK